MYCRSCGKELPENALFCGYCGARVQAKPESNAAAAPLNPESAAASAPTKTEPAAASAPTKPESAAAASLNAMSSRVKASGQSGELPLGPEEAFDFGLSANDRGVFSLIGGRLKSVFTSFLSLFREPKRLIPALILAVVWLALDILKASGVEHGTLKAASFLTFANGGMDGGFMGFLGGLLGKGLCAGALSSLIGRFSKARGGEKRSFADTLRGGFGFRKENLWSWLAGIGAGLLLFLFISGGAVRISFMAGAAAAYLAARSALRNGLLKQLLSFAAPKGRGAGGLNAAGLISGLALGFAAAALLSLADQWLVLLIPGGILLLGGAVMMILQAAGVLAVS